MTDIQRPLNSTGDIKRNRPSVEPRLAEAVERVERLISTFENHGAQMIASRHIRDLRTILSSLKGDEEMVERCAKIAESHATCGCNGKHGSCLVDDLANGIAEDIRAISVIGE